MSTKTSIILCTYNEVYYIKNTVEQIQKIIPNLELIIVDDNSTDGSREIIKNLAKNNQNINYIFRPKKMGVGSAHKDGFVWAYKKNYKIEKKTGKNK